MRQHKPTDRRASLRPLVSGLALLLITVQLSAGGHNTPVLGKDLVVIHAGTLLAIPGEAPQREQSIVIENGRIVRVESGFATPEVIAAEFGTTVTFVDLSNQFVLPGLMDAHVHIMAQPGTFVNNARRGGGALSKSDLALTGAVYAQRTLAAGFTTVRDLGTNNESVFALRKAINMGLLPGPTLLTSGPTLSATGAHGDRGFAASNTLDPDERRADGVCDGAHECIEQVRHNQKIGVDLIKFTATGGFMSTTGTQQQYEAAEMQAIVETAHQRDLKVAVHAYAANATRLALDAGVDSVEHGWLLDEKTLKQMKQQGTYLVPTLLISRPSAWANMAGTAKGAAQRDEFKAFETAYAMGVNIAFGTDVGIFDHGQNALEFELMTELGMSAEDAIISATIATADLFGISDAAGTLEAGKLADIIAVDASPLDDIGALKDVVFVMKGGTVVKQNGEYTGAVKLRPVGSPVKF
ncbi:MAG: amidohydrolase family protein [Gammaproteobacteria bacterium]